MSNQDKINSYFNKFEVQIQNAVTQVIPILANDTVNFALDNFARESWDGVPWPERKDKKNKRKLLVKSGRLKRSVRVSRLMPSSYGVGSDVPWAAVHNYGDKVSRPAMSESFVRNRKTKGKGIGRFTKGVTSGQGFSKKAYDFKMPKRQFLGVNKQLVSRLQKLAKEEILKAMKL